MVALKLEGLEVMLGLEELWSCVGAGASVCEDGSLDEVRPVVIFSTVKGCGSEQ